jgi:hypothetical protein
MLHEYSERNCRRYSASRKGRRSRSVRRQRAVLKAPLRKYRHLQPGQRANAAADDLALEFIQPRHIVLVSSMNGMASATAITEGRSTD